MLKHTFFSALLGMLVVPSLVLADAPAGKVRSKLGDVDRQKENQEAWKPLSVGTSVFQSDRVRTGTESEVIFGMPDGSVISVAENADVVIAELFAKDGAFKTKLDVKKGHLQFDVKKLSDKSSFEFKTGTATAAIRGTKGFIGGAKGFVGSLKEGKLEITSSKSGRKVTIGAGETALGRDSLVVMKLASSGNPALAKKLEKLVEDTTLTLDKILDAAKTADSEVAASASASGDAALNISTTSASVCKGGLKIEGTYRTNDPTATLVVKAGGTYVSENLAIANDGKDQAFSISVPVTDANRLWTVSSADVVLTSGGKETVETVKFSVDKTCAEVNTQAGVLKFNSYDSLRCQANVSVSGIDDDAAIFAVSIDGSPLSQESLTRSALKRVKLSEGIHQYSFSITDMAQNKIEQTKKLGCFPPKKFNVQILGKQREVVPYPPAFPNASNKIVKSLQFSVRVPGGDHNVLYKVVVKQNGRIILEETLSQIQALDYQVPVDLKRNMVNKIDVEVTHKSGYVVKAQKVFEVF